MFVPFCFLIAEDVLIAWLTNHLTLSVSDESYFWNVWCALTWISMFLLLICWWSFESWRTLSYFVFFFNIYYLLLYLFWLFLCCLRTVIVITKKIYAVPQGNTWASLLSTCDFHRKMNKIQNKQNVAKRKTTWRRHTTRRCITSCC